MAFTDARREESYSKRLIQSSLNVIVMVPSSPFTSAWPPKKFNDASERLILREIHVLLPYILQRPPKETYHPTIIKCPYEEDP